MDRSDFDSTAGKIDWGYVFSTLLTTDDVQLGETLNPPPPPAGLDGPLCDPDTTESGHLYDQPGAHSQAQYLPYQRLVDGISRVAATSYPRAPLVGFNTHPLPVENLSGGYGGYFHLRAPPHTFEQPGPLMATGQAAPIIYDGPLCDPDTTQSGHLYGQPGAHSQGQYLPYQWPVDDFPRVAAASYPGAPLVGFNTHPLPVENLSGGYGGYFHLRAPPLTFEQPGPLMATGQAAPIIYDGPLCDPDTTQSGHLYGQPGAHSQGQYLPYQWPKVGFPAAASYPAAPPHPYNQMPAVRLPEDMGQNLHPIEALKRKRESQQHDDQQYVKRPPNAFMLFMKEQRPNVVASFNITDNALVNSILGDRWKLLSNKQKAKYYEEADEKRRLHLQKYPNWSSRENYGKRRKRNRRKAPTSDEASASKPQSNKKLRLTSVQIGVMVPSTSRTRLMQPSVPVCDIYQLPETLLSYLQNSSSSSSIHVADLPHFTKLNH